MLVPYETSPGFDLLRMRWTEISRQLFSLLQSISSNERLSAQTSHSFSGTLSGKILFVREGQLQVRMKGGLLFLLESEDCFLPWSRELGDEFLVETDFAVDTAVVPWDGLLRLAEGGGDLLSVVFSFYQIQCSILASLLSMRGLQDAQFVPTLSHVESGDVLIQQGDADDTVFTLAEGEADVFVDGVKVGEILEDEIFGALAAFSSQPRTATVVARTKGLVLGLPRDQFSALISARPHTVEKFIENMARSLVDTNERLVQLSRARSDELGDESE